MLWAGFSRSRPLTNPLAAIHPRSLKFSSDALRRLVHGRLWLQVLIGMVLGIVAGTLMGPGVGWLEPEVGSTVGNWLAFPGQLFLALIQMIVIPLVVASIIRGLMSCEDLEQLRSMGVRVVLYFLVTTIIATTIGLAVALTIRPGEGVSGAGITAATPPAVAGAAAAAGPPSFGELPSKLLTLLPANPLSSMVQSEMLQIVVFSIIVGAALIAMPPRQAKPILELFGSLQEVCMTVVRWAMLLAPVAVFGLMAQLTSKIGFEALLGMAVYVATVLLGLAILLGLYLLIIFAGARLSPLAFLRSTREVLLLAFSTSSSAAVMPLSIKTAEEQLGVRPSISQFVVPLGATINMNGTALYQAVAAIFLAQVYGIDLTLGQMVLIVTMTVGASIGSPATPGVGIVILAMVLVTVGIPPTGIALVMGVDRILDMSRTAINVAGDLVTCRLMESWVGGKRSVEEELAAEARREKRRSRLGEDVLVERGGAKPQSAG
ncbi:MAG: dicarboxylate/amino acid:cation symporter [Gammaproteobacteria bacterium]|nr:dicarboxylate/amino acid:cation symporter [Gammaproteobacteria bacterium]